MADVKIFLKAEDPSHHKPQHSASNTLALLVLSVGPARRLSPFAIQLLSTATWKQFKRRIRPLHGGGPALLPPLPYYDLDTSYPRLGAESDALRRRRELWGSQAMIPARERVVINA
jgi:hypothetical protein